MEEKVHVEAKWVKNVMKGTFEYYPAGYINPVEVDGREPDIVLKTHQAHKLVKFMEEEGYLQRTIDESVREEDLKITHRLLDLMEEKI